MFSLVCIFTMAPQGKAGARCWSCSINPNRTGNLSLLLLWTVSAQQAPSPFHLFFSITFQMSCVSTMCRVAGSLLLLNYTFAVKANHSMSYCVVEVQFLLYFFCKVKANLGTFFFFSHERALSGHFYQQIYCKRGFFLSCHFTNLKLLFLIKFLSLLSPSLLRVIKGN